MMIIEKFLTWLNSEQTLDFIMANRFLLILFVIVLIHLKHMTCSGLLGASLINLPGTFLHETAHFTVGLFLNAKPTSFDLFPKKKGGAYVLGSVGFRNLHFYNALPASIAPLALLFIGYQLDIYFYSLPKLTLAKYIVYVLLQSIIIENSMPSQADFKIGFGNFTGLIFYGIIIFLGLVLFLAYL